MGAQDAPGQDPVRVSPGTRVAHGDRVLRAACCAAKGGEPAAAFGAGMITCVPAPEIFNLTCNQSIRGRV